MKGIISKKPPIRLINSVAFLQCTACYDWIFANLNWFILHSSSTINANWTRARKRINSKIHFGEELICMTNWIRVLIGVTDETDGADKVTVEDEILEVAEGGGVLILKHELMLNWISYLEIIHGKSVRRYPYLNFVKI